MSSPSDQPDRPDVGPPAGSPTRRRLLAGGVVVAAGAVGAVAGLVHPSSRDTERPARPTPVPTPAAPPPELVAALQRETQLIDGLDHAAATPALTGPARLLRADHTAHAAAIRSLLERYPSPTARSTSPTAPPSGGPSSEAPSAATRTQLATAERGAAAAGVTAARSLSGDTAALLASIAACESAHAEWLT